MTGDGNEVAQGAASGNQSGQPFLRSPMHVKYSYDVAVLRDVEDDTNVSRLHLSALLCVIVVAKLR